MGTIHRKRSESFSTAIQDLVTVHPPVQGEGTYTACLILKVHIAPEETFLLRQRPQSHEFGSNSA